MKMPGWRLLLPAGILLGLLAYFGLQLGPGLFGREDATWQAIQERGVWRVGMDPSFPPFEFLDPEGRPVGYDVDLARALAEPMGVQVHIVAIGFDGLIDALRNGKIDSVISALPYNPRLTEDVRYSDSYFEAGVRLVVPDASSIAGVEDLGGASVAVEWGGAGDVQLRRLQKEEPSIQRVARPTQEEALMALVAGEAQAALVDGVALAQAQGQGMAVHGVGPALESTPYVIAMPPDAKQLAEHVDGNLTKLQKTGFLSQLQTQWFQETK